MLIYVIARLVGEETNRNLDIADYQMLLGEDGNTEGFATYQEAVERLPMMNWQRNELGAVAFADGFTYLITPLDTAKAVRVSQGTKTKH